MGVYFFMNKNFFILMLLVLLLSISLVSATEFENITSTYDENPIESIGSVDFQDEINLEENALQRPYQENMSDMNYLQESSQVSLKSSNSDDIIVVNDWDELQFYCAQTDKDYTLKLKENTNFYPTDPNKPIYQIKIKNNVKIIGSEGSFIGDLSTDARSIRFVAFLVEDNSVYSSLNFENVLFKNIKSVATAASGHGTMDGIFIQMGGIRKNILKNCIFQDIISQSGHSTIVYLKKGSAILENCKIINCTSNYGAVSVYDPNSVKSTDMIVRNCYFENNYASTEPGCINNCGKLTVYNTTFVKNRSFWWAGAIHTHAGGNTTIYYSNFTDNVAGWNGGALYTYAYLQVYNSVFIGNNCTTNNGGGAIGACSYQTDPHIYIENCLFKDNNNNCWAADSLSDGTGRGGAISLMDAGSIEVRDTTFIANAAAQGTAICAYDVAAYGSPDIIIVNNNFINHTRSGDVLIVRVNGTVLNISNNYFKGNSIVFSNLTLTKLSEGKEQATLQVNASLTNPTYYDSDILDKTLYDVYINNKYVKTVNSSTFSVDFGDFDICDVYVIPTISNRKSNEVTITSTREYIFVSKSNGNDNNNGISRQTPVNTIKRALELAGTCQNIILLDGDYSEDNIQIDYDVTIKGEGNATLTNATSFISNSNFILKNLKINNLNSNIFINQIKNSLSISHCIFTNNDCVLVNNAGFASISDSILLNNSQIITGDVNNIDVDYNWWGNAQPDLNINKFITLNITSDVESLENTHKANVNVNFYTNENQIYSNLPDIDLNILTINGIANENIIKSNSQVVYTLTAFEDGALSVNYNDFTTTKSFEFLKSNPIISLATEEVMVGDDVVIKVNLPSDCEGNLTVNVGNISKTNSVSSSVFTFSDLKAGNYNITVIYSGDKKYVSKNLTAGVNVDKYESTTLLNISEVNVGEDVLLTIRTTDSSTGTITLTINNSTQTLTLNNSKASYTIKNIKRGDYRITAVYSGDEKYLSSQESKFIEVDNLNATMNITAQDIVYGETEIIKITLSDDATGEVTVTVDGVTNTSRLVNGKAELSFSNLNAGFKNITVFYSGDDTYFNITGFSNFTIDKADLTFNISSTDIKIGKVAEITIQVAPRTSGTFIIGNDILTIPMSGLVTYGIADLEIGEYTYTAVYNGNNYKTVSNSTSFVVTEYPIPQVPNNGLNPQNTHKADYETSANGNVAFIIPFNETLTGDLVIDSLGNVYLTSDSGIYSFNQTSRLWYWSSNTFEGNLSGISISRDVVIAPKSGDTLYFINQTTGERYGGSNIYQGSSLFAPVVDSNANLYIVSEYQYSSEDYKLVVIPYSLWENGGDPTLVTIGNAKPLCSPTLNDDIIVVISDNRFRLINAKTLETVSIKSGNFQAVRPVIGEGNIIYAILSDSIVAYNGNGVQVWKTKVTGGAGTVLALDNEQGLYHVNAKGILYRYDLIDGKQSKFSDLKVTSGILIDANNNLYFASENTFYAMDNEGNILWKSILDYKITGNPVMDASGLIYVPTENSITALTYAPLRDAINVTVNDIFVGETAQITIDADSQIVNQFTYIINGETFTGDAGTITKSLSDLKAGNYSVEISYEGDARFNSQNQVSTFEVKKLTPTLTASAENITVGQTLQISIDTDATGLIYTVVNGNNYTAENNRITIPNLKANTYTASIVYAGNDKYESIAKEIKFTVSKVSVSLDDALSISDDNTTFTVKLDGDATGNIKVSVDNVEYTKDLSGGLAEVVIPKLSEGPHNIKITYSGDDKYLESIKSIVLTGENVTPVDNTTQPVDNTTNTTQPDDNATNTSDTNQSVSVPDEAFTIPEDGSDYSISLPSDATGTLTVTVDGNEYSQELVNGKATVTVPELSEGSHNVTVTYSGDSKYAPVTKTTVVVKDPVNATGDNNSTIGNNTGNNTGDNNSTGENATQSVPDEAFTIPENGSDYSISLPSDATGTLTVTVDGKEYSQKLVNGKATVSIPELSEGSHNIIISYSGDSKYSPISKTSVVVKDSVNSTSGNNTGNATGDNNSTGENATQPVPDEAFTIPESGSDYSISLPSDATGTLTVTVDGVPYTQELVNGKATVSIPELSEGSHNITVTYSGDNKYASITKSSVVVKEHVPVIKLTASNLSMLYTSGKYFKVRLTSDGKALPNQKVKITINGKTYTKTTDKNGYASLKISLPPKAYTVKATYGNLTLTKKVTVKTVIQAKNVNAKKSSKSIKIKVTLKKVNKKYLKNKKVTLKFNKKTFKAKTNKKGVVTFTIKKNVYNKLKANKKYTYQVIYGKDKVKKSIKFKK